MVASDRQAVIQEHALTSLRRGIGKRSRPLCKAAGDVGSRRMKVLKIVPVCDWGQKKISVWRSNPFSPSWVLPPRTLGYAAAVRCYSSDKGKEITAKSKESLAAVTRAAAMAAKQFETLEKEAWRVAERAASRTRVSANGRFAARVQCDRFSAQFDGNDFAIELHE